MNENDHFIPDPPDGCMLVDPESLPGDYRPAKKCYLKKRKNMQEGSKKKKTET